MTRQRFYVGAVQGKSAEPVTEGAWNAIRAYLEHIYGGFTEYEAAGGWGDHREPCRVFECLIADSRRGSTEPSMRPDPMLTADFIKRTANQTCVLFTDEVVSGVFV